jgi:hypothetical protein
MLSTTKSQPTQDNSNEERQICAVGPEQLLPAAAKKFPGLYRTVIPVKI